MHKGWFQIAFEDNLKFGINSIDVFESPIVIFKERGKIRAFDAVCPHRGANLGNGKLEDDCIVCPFHGCKIGLNGQGDYGFAAVEYPLLVKGGLVFVNISKTLVEPFEDFFTDFDNNHFIIPGFEMKVNVRPEMVIENAFDEMHFKTVHSIFNEPKFNITSSNGSEYVIEGTFDVPKSTWQKGNASIFSLPYEAKAFSPFLVVSHLGGSNPYYVITSVVQTTKNESCIRLSIAIKGNEKNQPPPLDACRYLVEQSRKGLELDKKIWENMAPNAISRFVKGEQSVIGFQTFCKQFK